MEELLKEIMEIYKSKEGDDEEQERIWLELECALIKIKFKDD